jgi:uncharacterized membrane protein AbrB (regulator of aidB expression)
MTLVEQVIIGETVLGSVGAYVFCAWYWWKQKRGWPKTEHGWFMMTLGFSLGSLFTLVVFNRLVGPWPGRDIAVLVLYTLLIGLTLWMPRLVYLSYRERTEDTTRK